MSDRDNGVATGSGNIRASAFDQRFSRYWRVVAFCFGRWLAASTVYPSCCEACGLKWRYLRIFCLWGMFSDTR
ncbi:hypothetical protein, partial [Paenibacillus odorifer]|uniref:hypothetical protein n=1 Tax=Paenibacillus odorifer TaxID=189426 RepID=UPI001C4BE548